MIQLKMSETVLASACLGFALINSEEIFRIITKYLISEKETISEISLEGAKLVEKNSELGLFVFEFQNAIAPNQEIKFEYTIDKQLRGFETSKNIVANGSYIQHRDFEPRLGYSSRLEISNPLERKKRGLPEIETEEISDDHILSAESSVGRVYFATVVSTEKDQTALSSGELIEQWTKDNRNYFNQVNFRINKKNLLNAILNRIVLSYFR